MEPALEKEQQARQERQRRLAEGRSYRVIIGIDHGYGGMKTAHTVIPTAIAKFAREPAVAGGHMLLYEDSYYRIGGQRIRLRRDKTTDEMYWVLTLYAIAAEIEARGVNRKQTVVIAAGLPLAELALSRDTFRQYLRRAGEHQFLLDGEEYRIIIEDVQLYPQGYAAVMPMIGDIQAASTVHIIDIGAWTTDTVSLVHGIASDGSERSLENGVIKCLAEVREQLRQDEHRTYTDQQIEDVLWGGQGLPTNTRQRMKASCIAWCTETLRKLDEAGLDTTSAPAYFLGGGAFLMEQYLPSEQKQAFLDARFVSDVRANARGYESICTMLLAEAS